MTPELTFRERLAIRVIGLATWCLPVKHPAIPALYQAAWSIESRNNRFEK